MRSALSPQAGRSDGILAAAVMVPTLLGCQQRRRHRPFRLAEICQMMLARRRISPDPEASIAPNEGLGGIPLRLQLHDVENLSELIGWDWNSNPAFRLDTPYTALYRLADGAISMFVDIRVGKIYLLCAYFGYTGPLLGQIRIGMRIRDALAVHSDFYWDDDEDVYFSRSIRGVSIWPEITNGTANLEETPIGRISVFASEAYTAMGQLGYW